MNTVVKFSSRHLKKLPFLLPHAKTIKHTPLISAAKRDIQKPLGFSDRKHTPLITIDDAKIEKRDIEIKERKVCIVCSDYGEAFRSKRYMVFIVDLKWESASCDEMVTSWMTPTLRFDAGHFFSTEFCVVGSTLYMFEGYDIEYSPGEGKSMYTYQLSDGISNLKLEKHMLSKGPSMNQAIGSPTAAVTPDGKIVVFNRNARHYQCDFEMYDPVERVWETLPSLRPYLGCVSSVKKDFYIESFTFMKGKGKGRNVFFVKTDVGGFALEILSRKKVWKTDAFHCARCVPRHRGTSLVLINKEICIIPYTAFDIKKYDEYENVFNKDLYYNFPDLYEFRYEYACGGGVVLLPEEEEEEEAASKQVFNVCFLQMGINEETYDPELLLQVYSCNLKECRKELRKYRKKKIEEHPNRFERKTDAFDFPGAKKVKTLRIMVKYEQEPFYALLFSSYASIPPIQIACQEKKNDSDCVSGLQE